MNQSSGSAASALSSSSHVYQPNYPLKEPVFYVPRVPQLSPAPPPAPPLQRPPQPGYDMKTLRRQVDYLSQEITERAESHAQVSKQNESLWQYVHELLEANKFNATAMRQHVAALNDELRAAHRERLQLADRLSTALGAKRLVEELSRELDEHAQDAQVLQTRRQEAEKALKEARDERSQAEATLRAHAEQLSECEDALDRYREIEREQASLHNAEEHFLKSKTVLRRAYTQFRSGVLKQMRLSRLETCLQSIRRSVTRSETWALWKSYLSRRRLWKRNQQRRRRELLLVAMANWKHSTKADQQVRRRGNRALARRIWSLWREFVQDARANHKLQVLCDRFQDQSIARGVLAVWKSQTCFLEWNSTLTLRKYRHAERHFLVMRLQAWRAVTVRALRAEHDVTLCVNTLHLQTHFALWRVLSLRRWRHRGQLLRRCFANLRRDVALRGLSQVRYRRAAALRIECRLRIAVRRWGHWASAHRHSCAVQAARDNRRKAQSRIQLRSCLWHWMRLATIHARQHAQQSLAKRTLYRANIRDACLRWKRFAKSQSLRKKQQLQIVMRKFVRQWRHNVRLSTAERKKSAGVVAMIQTQRSRVCRDILREWSNRVEQRRRARHCSALCVRREDLRATRRAFGAWLRVFLRHIRTASQYTAADLQRTQRLVDLQAITLSEEQRERMRLQDCGKALEDTLLALQETLAEKEELLAAERLEATALKEQKAQLLVSTASLQETLSTVEGERDRLRAVRDALQQEREMQQEMLSQARRTSAQRTADRVRILEDEVAKQRMQLQSECEQLEQSLREAESESKAAQVECERVYEQSENETRLLTERSLQVAQLTAEQASLSTDLEHLRRRVSAAVTEQHEMRTEGDELLSSRRSELTTLKGEAGLAAARVGALHEVCSQYERERRADVAANALHEDEAELMELRAIKSRLEEEQRRSLAMSRRELSVSSSWKPNHEHDVVIGDVRALSNENDLSEAELQTEAVVRASMDAERDFAQAKASIRLLSEKLHRQLAASTSSVTL